MNPGNKDIISCAAAVFLEIKKAIFICKIDINKRRLMYASRSLFAETLAEWPLLAL